VQRKLGLRALAAACLLALLATLNSPASGAVPITNASDALRTGWYPDQTQLNSDVVSGGSFGRLYSTAVTGQVYAQPLLADDTLLVATEDNWIYGLNPRTGAIRWQRNVGTPFNASDVSCSDLSPRIGITGTPVVDPDTHTAYFFSKTYVSGVAAWFAHAVEVSTGAERAGFPVQITGNADNAPSVSFNAKTELERPGLLLMNGVVYGAFGGHCDRTPYQGWVVGASTAGAVTAKWVTPASGSGAGIWQSGGGLVSDGSGQILVTTGNGGTPTSPTPGSSPPAGLGESVVRLAVQANGTLQATDFFAPYDAAKLDTWDADFGSGGPVALPAPWFGTLNVPNLMVAVGKQGYVYLLNRSSLGGIGQGPGGSDQVVSRIGPYGGVWSRPAVWPGDGGYVYMPTASGGTAGGSTGNLQVYSYGVDGGGNPTLSRVASSSDAFGFGSSAPVVTSSGTASGSALMWIVWSPDASGNGAQLRAYAPVPSGGRPTLLFSAPVGQSAKFNPPGVGDNRIYVGARDGHVLGFGAPVDPPLLSTPLVFPDTKVGQTSTVNEVFSAAKDVTVTSVSSTSARFTPSAGALPRTLHTGDTFTVPVTFAPSAPGPAGGSLQVITSEGQVNVGLSGTGQPADAQLSVSPPVVSFGGTVVGGHLAGTVTISNVGGSPLTFNSVGGVPAPFAVTGAPAPGATLAAGRSVSVGVSFSPTEPGDFTDVLTVDTSAGSKDIGLSGSATGPAHLKITPPSFSGWYLPVGSSEERSFELRNVGDTRLTLTKSKPPTGATLRAVTELPEGTTIDPGHAVTVKVGFAPTAPGPETAQWDITGTDDSGPHTVTFGASGVALSSSASAPASSTSPSFGVRYSAVDTGGPGLDDVELWAATPADPVYHLVATGSGGAFPYSATAGNGVYRFYTRARDKAGIYENAPAAPDASVTVAVPLAQPLPLFAPKATPAARVTKLALNKATFRVRYSLSTAANVTLHVERRGAVRMRRTLRGVAGTNSFRLRTRRLRPGRYRLVLTPAGGQGRTLRFRVSR
jgi:hypothetical protein